MAIKGVTVVSVPVSDPERARRFYVDKLGMEVRLDDSSIPGMRWILIGPEGGATALTLVTWFDSMPAGSLQGLVLSSSDIRADYKMFKERGVEFVGPPKPQPWGRTETVLRDPDGNSIVLQQE
jgi:catechol 2,3-dioxygenase-like lactoylglutathione lyase family enzyme